MRGLLHHAALALLVILTSADVARAFTPTSDLRYIHADLGFPVPTKTAVPFQPFNEGVQIIVSGVAIGGAGQNSSFLADGIVGSGGAAAGTSGSFSPFAESVLDVRFDLAQSSVFSLTASLFTAFTPGVMFFILERTAPSPAVLVSLSGVAELDQLVGMPVGSYRLRVTAQGSGGNGSTYDFDFRLACSSASAQDSDGDALFDACDQCPFAFDPGQEDTDGDSFGDACNDAVDFDGDDYADTLDNCPADSNPDQIDADYDERGDVCDDPESITRILEIDSFRSVARVALASDGTVYATVSPWIYQIPPVGPQVQLINGLPIGAQFLDVAVGLDGMVYTAGASLGKSYRIHPVTRVATLLIGPAGDGVNALTYANRVAVAPDGRVFVSGRDSQNVFEITSGGAISQILGPAGNGTVALGQPRALEVDPDGNLYVLSLSQTNSPRLFRVTPSHQVQLVSISFPISMNAYDLALGQDGSIYIAGGGIVVRRPSGTTDVLLPDADPRSAVAIDVDARGVVHVVQGSSGSGEGAFRITPGGQIGPLIGPSGDGQGHNLGFTNDVAVADGSTKRIVVGCHTNGNAFLVTDFVAVAVPLFGPVGWGALALALLGVPALARWRRSARGIGALALLAVLAPAGVARAFTPTQDDRYVHVTMAQPTETVTPVPFQPFSDGRFVLVAGLPIANAGQLSSFLDAGVQGEGSAMVDGLGFGLTAESILDVRFDLADDAVFALELTLSRSAFASSTFVLERTAPSPAVLISMSTNATLDQQVELQAGSYQLRAAARAFAPGANGTSAKSASSPRASTNSIVSTSSEQASS